MSINWDIYSNFSEEEFRCKCGCGRADMDTAFIGMLQNLRWLFDAPIQINSGFRCPEHNNAVSSTGLDGPHTTGKAADTGVIVGKAAYKLLGLALEMEFTGLGLKQKGPIAGRFIHLDILPPSETRPWVWTY